MHRDMRAHEHLRIGFPICPFMHQYGGLKLGGSTSPNWWHSDVPWRCRGGQSDSCMYGRRSQQRSHTCTKAKQRSGKNFFFSPCRVFCRTSQVPSTMAPRAAVVTSLLALLHGADGSHTFESRSQPEDADLTLPGCRRAPDSNECVTSSTPQFVAAAICGANRPASGRDHDLSATLQMAAPAGTAAHGPLDPRSCWLFFSLSGSRRFIFSFKTTAWDPTGSTPLEKCQAIAVSRMCRACAVPSSQQSLGPGCHVITHHRGPPGRRLNYATP